MLDASDVAVQPVGAPWLSSTSVVPAIAAAEVSEWMTLTTSAGRLKPEPTVSAMGTVMTGAGHAEVRSSDDV
jgi:hypothetical protein